jgi:hypothetical protein
VALIEFASFVVQLRGLLTARTGEGRACIRIVEQKILRRNGVVAEPVGPCSAERFEGKLSHSADGNRVASIGARRLFAASSLSRPDASCLGPEGMDRMYTSGVCIGVHSHRGRNLTTVSCATPKRKSCDVALAYLSMAVAPASTFTTVSKTQAYLLEPVLAGGIPEIRRFHRSSRSADRHGRPFPHSHEDTLSVAEETELKEVLEHV